MENYTAGELVTNILREKIFSGEIQDNIELTQTWVAEQLGVSRMPIREALLNLELEGFIERLDNRHTKIIGFSKEHAKSRLRFLASLSSDAAIGITESKDLQSIQIMLAAVLENSFDKQREIQFHTTLFTEGHDRYLNQVYRKLAKPTLELFIYNRQFPSEKSQSILLDIVEKMKNRNTTEIKSLFEKYFMDFQTKKGLQNDKS